MNIVLNIADLTKNLNLKDLIEKTTELSTLKSYYAGQKGEESLSKLENLEELMSTAERFEQNNLDSDVAEKPEELIVYGGLGKAARNWECYEQILASLKSLENDEPISLDTTAAKYFSYFNPTPTIFLPDRLSLYFNQRF